MVEKIEVVRVGKARRAKLYYLRERLGKAAKTKEAIGARIENKEIVIKGAETEEAPVAEETVAPVEEAVVETVEETVAPATEAPVVEEAAAPAEEVKAEEEAPKAE